jgi:hypothetical protein
LTILDYADIEAMDFRTYPSALLMIDENKVDNKYYIVTFFKTERVVRGYRDALTGGIRKCCCGLTMSLGVMAGQ